ncbi:response regulator transcription factor [bacterium]|nr:response regulator transcription factor [bacterium]
MTRHLPPRDDPSVTILIVDDHPVTREGLAALLSRQPGFRVCGEAEGIPGALRQVAAAVPDLVVVDVSLKDGNGLDLVKRLRDRFPRVKVLVWSMYPDAMYARRAVQAGAAGYINKGSSPDAIMGAIRHVLAGEVFLSPEVTQSVLHAVAGNGYRDEDPISSLSDRELEIFHLIGLGLDTHETASRLHLSPKTVETYRTRIRAKLGAETGTAVLRSAIRWVLENG